MKALSSVFFAVCATLLAWGHAHPLAVAALVSAAAACAHDQLARFPRLQALTRVAAAAGFDAPKLLSGLVQLWTGAPPQPKPPTPPQAPPGASAVVGASLCLSVALGGCASAPAATSTAAQQADVAAYTAEEQACVQNADGSLAAAEACIAGVKSRWCGDGGELAGYCVGQSAPAPKDGGAQ